MTSASVLEHEGVAQMESIQYRSEILKGVDCGERRFVGRTARFPLGLASPSALATIFTLPGAFNLAEYCTSEAVVPSSVVKVHRHESLSGCCTPNLSNFLFLLGQESVQQILYINMSKI